MRTVFTVAAFVFAGLSANAQPIPCDETQPTEGQYACKDVTLLSRVSIETMRGRRGNDLWGWTDSETGREYALMGLDNGVAFVDVTDPVNPVYLGNLPTHTTSTVWRDLKTYGDFLFVISEADRHGMQVFDLAHLRGVAPTQGPMTFKADAHYGRIGQSHNVIINEETATAFIVGSRAVDGCNGGLHMVDISSPLQPVFTGCFSDDGYTHDAQCIIYDGPDTDYTGHEICFASNEDTITIVDVTDRKNAVMLSQAIYPNEAYTHQGWLTEDRRFFIANDELDEMRYRHNTRSLIFDVSDLDAAEFSADYISENTAIDHNLYIRGDKVYEANYRSGLYILDASNVAEGELTPVAHFDTFPDDDIGQFGGAWSAYPFFESGTVLVADSQYGLFALRPERAEPLPLAAFAASSFGQGIDLSWTTSDATESSRFYVEREVNGRWAQVGMVRAVPGRDLYRFRVGGISSGEHTFRLRAIGLNGLTGYSTPTTVMLGATAPSP